MPFRAANFRRWGLSLALWAGLSAAAVRGQQVRSLEQTLDRLQEQAVELGRELPSFTCDETVVSEELHGGRVRRRVDFTATLRLKRTGSGALAESYQYTSRNGTPFTGGGFSYPIYVEGGFDKAMGYFTADARSCYRYWLAGDTLGGVGGRGAGRIDFASGPAAAERTGCETGLQGFALFDAEGHITHLERRVDPVAGKDRRLVPFAAIDFAAVELNGRSYRLSHRMVAETPRDRSGKTVDRFEATYSGCRLYTATVTLGPASEVPPEGPPPLEESVPQPAPR
jgi:hypothetical protein